MFIKCLFLIIIGCCFCSATRTPVKILVPDDTKTKLVVIKEGLDVLRQMPSHPVSVVTFIGRARSGKSFTLDNLLHVPYETGFEVGHTNKPKTVGADLWPYLITAENATDYFLVFDTEGLGTGPQTYDKALLLLFALISSRIVYHVSEYIYTDDVAKLYGIACLAAHYESRDMLSTRHNMSLLPPISWVVQKYRLNVENPLDAMNDWLGEKENIDNNQYTARFNTTVRIVRTMFPGQTVHLIPPADLRIEHHACLTDISKEKLEPEYLSEMKLLEQTLFNVDKTPVKMFTNKVKASPSQIADMIVDLLPAANLGFEYVGDKVAETLSRAILTDVIANITDQISNIELPMDIQSIESLLVQLKDTSIAELDQNLPSRIMGIVPTTFRADIESHILTQRDKILRENEYQSDQLCDKLEDVAISFFASPERIRTFNGNTAVFEAAYEIALARYRDSARGPARSKHESSIKTRADETRNMIGTDITPRRKIVWSVVGTAIILCAHFVTTLAEKWITKTRTAIFIYISFSGLQFITCGVVLLVIWSIFDTPPIAFETLSDSLKPGMILTIFALLLGSTIATTLLSPSKKTLK